MALRLTVKSVHHPLLTVYACTDNVSPVVRCDEAVAVGVALHILVV